MQVNNHKASGQVAFAKNANVLTSKAVNTSASSGSTKKANMDTVSFSAEALSMLNTQQTTGHAQVDAANVKRTAAGLSARELPTNLITEREFTVFSRNALAPHMEDAEKHLALMKRAISNPSRFANADLTLAERTMMRESILQEAQRIADTYLSDEEAQRFVDGFENLIREAEMIEKGYVREGGLGTLNIVLDNVTFRSPFSEPDSHALSLFVDGNMTDTQRVQFDLLTEEVNRLSDLSQAIATGLNSEMSFQEVLDTFNEATAALRAFVESMGEYHGFQEQWEAFHAGSATADNWFVQATAIFESTSAEIAEQIVEVRFNFHNQLNLNGMNGFRNILEQMGVSNADSLSWQWLMQLPIFDFAE